ncbi:MAG TPA: cyclodeaminase/cyclohydrolase family protein [Candidatus Acidoferrales bacterium]|nr:cyclodeaminase/cyclohydrolase family protein [Candidatus Acidoferrales bacterium]
MPDSVCNSTLESFRSAAASGEPMPAGVAVSAVAASFAFGLLAKVLKVSGRRQEFTEDRSKLERLGDAARAESRRMMQIAEEDVAAFNEYMANARLPRATEQERTHRERAIDSAVRKAIEIPLAAARGAATGIGLCDEATRVVHAVVAADLGASTSLLAGALRVFLLCADSNIRLLARDATSFQGAIAERDGWESEVFGQADAVVKRVRAVIDAAGPERT